MTLGEKQRLFALDVSKLIAFVFSVPGREVRFDEAYRSPEEAKANEVAGIGIANSLHTLHLAVDLSLFVNGDYQTTVAAYAPLGVFWEGLRPGNAWGGRFARPDADHFSASYNGVR